MVPEAMRQATITNAKPQQPTIVDCHAGFMGWGIEAERVVGFTV
jgi:hypothetical protein